LSKEAKYLILKGLFLFKNFTSKNRNKNSSVSQKFSKTARTSFFFYIAQDKVLIDHGLAKVRENRQKTHKMKLKFNDIMIEVLN